MDSLFMMINGVDYSLDKELLSILESASVSLATYKTLLTKATYGRNVFIKPMLAIETYMSLLLNGERLDKNNIFYYEYMKDENAKRFNEVCEALNKSSEDAYQISASKEVVEDVKKSLFNNLTDANLIRIAILYQAIIRKYHNYLLAEITINDYNKILTGDEKILFLSEVLVNRKDELTKLLEECANGYYTNYFKFFLKLIDEMANKEIERIKKIDKIYDKDMKIASKINGKNVYKVIPATMSTVMFTKRLIVQVSGVSRNVNSNIIERLITDKIIEQDTTVLKKCYKHKDMFNLFKI